MTEPKPRLYDVNALVALCLTTHVHHRAAHRHLAAVTGRWVTTPLTEAGLVRLLLNPLITGRQLGGLEATEIVAGLGDDPRWSFLEDRSSLARPVVDTSVLSGHRQVTDLHLLNLAAANDVVLATFDGRLPTWLAPRDRRHVEVITA